MKATQPLDAKKLEPGNESFTSGDAFKYLLFPDSSDLSYDSRWLLRGQSLHKLAQFNALKLGAEALHPSRQTFELSASLTALVHFAGKEPVLACAMAENLAASNEPDKVTLGVLALARIYFIDGKFPEIQNSARSIIERGYASDPTPNGLWANCHSDINTPTSPKVALQGTPYFGEKDFPVIRNITSACEVRAPAAIAKLLQRLDQLDIRRERDLILTGLAGMVAALYHPQVFEHQLLPKFEASGDPGLKFLCEQFRAYS